jgi:hypothetical protein
MSNVSFSDCDITRIRFSDNVTWGGKDGFTIIEDYLLIQWLKDKSQGISLRRKISSFVLCRVVVKEGSIIALQIISQIVVESHLYLCYLPVLRVYL